MDSLQEKEHILGKIAALRRQGMIFLILILVGIITTLVLVMRLKITKSDLESEKARSDSLAQALEAFRQEVLRPVEMTEHAGEPIHASKLPHVPERDESASTKPTKEKPKESAMKVLQSSPPLTQKVELIYKGERKMVVTKGPLFGYLIYLQDREGSQVAPQLRQTLKAQGAIVPDIQHMKGAESFITTVKYFHVEDVAAAQAVYAELEATYKALNIPFNGKAPDSKPYNAKVPVGQLEVWMEAQSEPSKK